jgi:hypothetical protein
MQSMRFQRRLSHLVLAGLAGSGLPSGADAGQPPEIRVGIVVEPPAAAAVHDLTPMVAEADAIWRPHGVTIGLVARDDVAAGWVRMSVFLEATASRGHQSVGLGSIWFAEDGLPAPLIRLNVSAVSVRIRSERIGGRRFDSWPQSLERRITTRALGRVLAHEVGHYVLASPAHSRSGLMRASFSGRQLAEWDRSSFALEPVVLPRLRARLARLASAQNPLVAERADPNDHDREDSSAMKH